MKLTKKPIALCAVAILAVALIAALAIVGGASEATPSFKFVAQTLNYESKIEMVFYVEAKNAIDVDLLVWSAPQSEYKRDTAEWVIAEPGRTGVSAGGYVCDVYYFDGYAAKQMPEWVYVCAYTNVGGVDYYSEPIKYSILQYAYNMLSKDSTKPETKALVEALLEYGGAAQVALGHNTNRLANAAWKQIKVVGGTLDDGFANGLYLEGDALTLTAPESDGAGKVFSHWENSTGTYISTDRVYEIEVGDAEETYIAVYALPTGLFDANGNRLASWEELVNDYGLDVEKDYTDSTYSSDTASLYYVLNNNDEFSTGTKLVIKKGVTVIGSYAFYNCDSLTSVTIPADVTSIGDCAFRYCDNLASVNVPESVTYIGASSINSCEKIIWDFTDDTRWEVKISSIYGQCPIPDGSSKTLKNLVMRIPIYKDPGYIYSANYCLRKTMTINSGIDYNVAGDQYLITLCFGDYALRKVS